MRKIALSIAAVLIIVSSAHQAWAEGLDSLIEAGKAAADIEAGMQEETRAFDAVKEAVDSGAIKKGLSREFIREQYGEPVIINNDSATGREKWAYKPATSTFLEGIRIYLYFDSKGMLDEIKTAK